MDSITQAALGGLCGELVLRKQLGWKGALWGVFFGTLPDLDIFMSPWLDDMESLRNHRSLSHSLFLMLLMSPMFGWLLARLHKHLSIRRATSFVLLTWATHVLIDCFNSYGTQVLEPFSNYRVAFGNMAIADLFFTLPMLLGNFLCLFCAREGKARSIITWTTTTWISLYALASVSLLLWAKSQFQQKLQRSNIATSEMLVSPTLSNIFLWRMVARDPNHYYVSYWSVWDDPKRPIHIDTIPRSPQLADPYQNTKTFNTLDWFSKGWWKVFPHPTNPNSIYFVDMRFGEIQNFKHDPPLKVTPFIWQLTNHDDGSISQQQVRMREGLDMKAAIQQLQERAAGHAPNWHLGIWPWENKFSEF
ncbi:metal-dependent hydrolase [Rubritalea tangerina]|uniref:Metal-dependent hydrolase n=1 Tax=Rubritalea tangerina TaxID=430798 RepID=A0ABW4ZBY9_9BACT